MLMGELDDRVLGTEWQMPLFKHLPVLILISVNVQISLIWSVKTSRKESYFEISTGLRHYAAKFRCQPTPTVRKILHAGSVSGISSGDLKTANVNIDPCCAGAEQQLQNKHCQELLLVYNKPLGLCAVTFRHGKNYFLIQYFCLVF